jgi:putative transposase
MEVIMSFWRAFYHLVWSTKERQPLLMAAVEPFAFEVMHSKAVQLDAVVFALNGTENHVHLVVAMPPRHAAAEFVRQVKAVTSYRINQERISPIPFYWQNEYGLFTFDEKRLPHYVRYVERQKEHHAQQQVIPILERTETMDPPRIRETPILYETEGANALEWWDEMAELG